MNRFRSILLILCLSLDASAGDWPQWRANAGHGARSAEALPSGLKPDWSLQFSTREQVWDDPLNWDLMTYDRVFEPVAKDGRLYVAFNDRDKVVAYDIKSGQQLWTFFTGGPVRLAPAAWQDKLYLVSDDGYLYCLDAATGERKWAFRGAPSARKALGNKRVVSAWPARGGVVVKDGRVYFTASIWPFMGTYFYCLDATSGAVIWLNDGTSFNYIKQPHGAPAFAGIAPQGILALAGDKLVIPGGRSIPAVFDAASGKELYFHHSAAKKGVGGSSVFADDSYFYVHTRQLGVRAHRMADGRELPQSLQEPILEGDKLYTYFAGQLHCVERKAFFAPKPSDPGYKLSFPMVKKMRYLKLRGTKLTDGHFGIANLTIMRKDGVPIDKAKARWHEKTVSSTAGEQRIGNAFDKSPTSYWLSEKEETAPEVTVSVGNWIDFDNVYYLPPAGKAKGRASGIELYVSSNRKDWTKVFAGDLEKKQWTKKKPPSPETWTLKLPPVIDMIKTADTIYAATAEGILVVDCVQRKVIDKLPTQGEVIRLIAASDRLIAVNLEGAIMTYSVEGNTFRDLPNAVVPATPAAAALARATTLVKAAADTNAYAMLVGPSSLDEVSALLRASQMHLLVLDAPADKVDDWRRRLDAAGLYGKRVSVFSESPAAFKAPAYIFQLISLGAQFQPSPQEIEALWHSLRPYGGVLAMGPHAPTLALAMPQAQATERNGEQLVRKQGALLGSGDWTHVYGDMGNTVKSDDSLIKLPLGVLWFGGNSNLEVLPRHGHGPPEQVVGGRLVIEGMDMISARDVYTGRVLWKKTYKELGNYGVYYDKTYKDTPLSTAYNQVHIPGAAGRGTNYVALHDKVYVLEGSVCHIIDAATGRDLRDVDIPRDAAGNEQAWGFIGLEQDYLIGGTGFANYSKKAAVKATNSWMKNIDLSGSNGLAVFDRHSGKKLWQVKANYSFLHNCIVAGKGKLYLLDRLPSNFEAKLKRRGQGLPDQYRILCLELKTGKQLWSRTTDIFGTWLAYSKQHDVLLQATSKAVDRSKMEAPMGLAAYSGTDGKVLWQDLKRQYIGPLMIHNETIITNVQSYQLSAGTYNLLTGKTRQVKNPVSGKMESWKFTRTYGCNTAIASEHLLTFRSGAAAFYDLNSHTGTGNFGGFKSSCTANLVVANGVLNAPDYTRTCTCGYQNQTSLGMVHMPELDYWVKSRPGLELSSKLHVENLGINFAAPGDRTDDDGLFWANFPSDDAKHTERFSVGGEKLTYHTHNALSTSLDWVSNNSVEGLREFNIKLSARAYALRLYFPAAKNASFHVEINGKRLLENVTLGNSAQRQDIAIAGGDIRIRLIPITGRTQISGISFQAVK